MALCTSIILVSYNYLLSGVHVRRTAVPVELRRPVYADLQRKARRNVTSIDRPPLLPPPPLNALLCPCPQREAGGTTLRTGVVTELAPELSQHLLLLNVTAVRVGVTAEGRGQKWTRIGDWTWAVMGVAVQRRMTDSEELLILILVTLLLLFTVDIWHNDIIITMLK